MENGLQGLGILNTKNDSATVGSPLQTVTNSVNIDTRLIDLSMALSQSDGFAKYVRSWAENTGVATLCDCEQSVMSIPGVFGLKLLSEETAVYNIIPCDNIEVARQIYQTLTSGSNTHTHKCVLVCPYTFEFNDIRKGSSLGVELLGYNEAQEINSAITSSMPYLAVGSTFVHKICKSLNSVYSKHNSDMALNRVKEAFTGDVGGDGGIIGSFKQGFGQLKSSVLGALGSKSDINTSEKEKLILPEMNNENQYNGNEGVTIEQTPSFDVPNYGTNITAGTMGGDERIPSPAESGEDIVTCGTMSKNENEIYVAGEEVSTPVNVNIEKIAEAEVVEQVNSVAVENTVTVSLDKTAEASGIEANTNENVTVSLDKPENTEG